MNKCITSCTYLSSILLVCLQKFTYFVTIFMTKSPRPALNSLKFCSPRSRTSLSIPEPISSPYIAELYWEALNSKLLKANDGHVLICMRIYTYVWVCV